MNILSKIGITIGLAIASFFGFHQTPAETPMVGATIPIATSFYSDSLQSGITKTATSMTLVKGMDSQGVTLAGYYGFVLDQGTASQEIVGCTASGVNLTSCLRGLDLTTGTSSVAALEQTHNRGGTVQITTSPIVNVTANILRGIESIPSPLFYNQNFIFSSSTQLASKGYVDGVILTGCANSSETVNGCVQLATGLQIASTTSSGSTGARLAIPASQATSTPGTRTSLDVVVTQNNGKIHQGFLDLSQSFNFTGTLFASSTGNFIASSTLFTANIGKIFATSSIAFTNTSGVASSSVLMNDTAGNLTYGSPQLSYLNFPVDSNGASTTMAYVTIPANSFGTSGYMEFNIPFEGFVHQSASTDYFEIAYGNSTTTVLLPWSDGVGAKSGMVKIIVGASGATNSQKVAFNILGILSGNSATTETLSYSKTGTYSVDSTANRVLMIVSKVNAGVHFTADAVVGSFHRN